MWQIIVFSVGKLNVNPFEIFRMLSGAIGFLEEIKFLKYYTYYRRLVHVFFWFSLCFFSFSAFADRLLQAGEVVL